MGRKKYGIDYNRYTFNSEDDWGYYDNGIYKLGYFDKNGYDRHKCKCDDGKWHCIYEHIAKWEYFNGKIPDGLQIDHIIPIKMGGTNKLSNLRVVTQKENINNPLTIYYRFKNGKSKGKNKGKGRVVSKETRKKMAKAKSKPVCQYTKQGELLRIWSSIKEIEKELKIYHSEISEVCRGKRKSAGGYVWKYKNDVCI